MITKIPFKNLSRRTQVRRPVFQIRRGRDRKTLIRMLGCSYCGGDGGYVIKAGDRELMILCGECNGGFPRGSAVETDFEVS